MLTYTLIAFLHLASGEVVTLTLANGLERNACAIEASRAMTQLPQTFTTALDVWAQCKLEPKEA